MRNTTAVLMALILAGCVSYSDTRADKNKQSFHMSKDYQTAYQVITTEMMKCEPPETIQTNIYPDQKLANVTNSSHNVVGWTIDLKDDGNGGTNADFYSVFKAQSARVELFKAWVEDGKTGCWPTKLKDA